MSGDIPQQQASPDVGRKTFRAAAWAFVSATGKRVLTLLGITLLARILAPHDFGLIGFTMVYLTFVEVIGDFGAGAALVYWPDRRDDAAQVTFLVNIGAGIFWCLVSLAIAPWVSLFFHEPAGTPLLRVLAVTIIIKAFGNAHDALAEKDLRFRERSIPELALTGFKAIVALVCAWCGLGVWSLVWGHIAGVTAWTILLWVVVPWRPSLRVPADLFGPMLRYGRSIVAVQVMSAAMFDVDVIVIGRFLGVTTLAIYQMAARVPESSVMVLIWVTATALFPAFSKLHAEGADVKRAFLVATRCVSALTLPASLGLFFLARPIILVFFGPKWIEAAPILSILSIYVAFRGVDEVGNVLKATGKTKALVWLTVIKAVLMVPAMLIGARYSATGVALALAIVFGISTFITTVLAARVIEMPLSAIAGAYLPSAKAAAVMSVALFGWMHWSNALLTAIQLGLGIVLGGVVYIAVLRLVDPEIFEWLGNTILRKKDGAGEALLRAGTTVSLSRDEEQGVDGMG